MMMPFVHTFWVLKYILQCISLILPSSFVSTIHAVQINTEHQLLLQVKVGESLWHQVRLLSLNTSGVVACCQNRQYMYVPIFSPAM